MFIYQMQAKHKKKRTRKPDAYDRQWEMQFFELQKFKKKHGHCDVPKTSKNKQYRSLAYWCITQRRLKKIKPLKYNPDRLRKLNEIGFSWSMTDKWFETKFRQLEKFRQKYGHCNVSRNSDNKQYYSLAAWCNTQRITRKLNPQKYAAYKVKRLNELGFAWSKLDEKFERKFSVLKEYHTTHGHCYVRKTENLEIASWCAWLRKVNKRKNISPEKIQRLNELGFPWQPEINRVRWERQFTKLEDYKKKHRHCNVSASKADRPYRHLLYWVILQREQYHRKNKHLTTERIKKLNSLGFNWINPLKKELQKQKPKRLKTGG